MPPSCVDPALVPFCDGRQQSTNEFTSYLMPQTADYQNVGLPESILNMQQERQKKIVIWLLCILVAFHFCNETGWYISIVFEDGLGYDWGNSSVLVMG